MKKALKTILLVEDVDVMALKNKLLLKKAGFNVIHVKTGEKAIEVVNTSNQTIDFILMDIVLGDGLDGIESAREILKDNEIPLLFLSSHTEKEILDKVEQVASYGYVDKASDESVLLASINMAFKLHKAYKELKENKESLQKSEESYRSLFENAIEGIFLVTPEGKILSANSSLAALHGYDSAKAMIEEIKDYWSEMFYDSSLKYRLSDMFAEGNEIKNLEIQVFSKQKQILWISASIRVTRNPLGNIQTFEGMVIDITQRKNADEQSRLFTAHLESVREQDKLNISREIHDELGQTLTAIKLRVLSLKKFLTNDYDKVSGKISEVSNLITGAMQTIHRICATLHPEILNTLGLLPAIEWQLNEFYKFSDIDYKLLTEIPGEDLSIPGPVSLAIFRILQEALTNIARHSSATKVKVAFKCDLKNIRLEILDNGIGIDDSVLNNLKSFGIIGMKERAKLNGGTFTIRNGNTSGTLIKLEFPYCT